MLFSSLGSLHMLIYLPNPIWRLSAIWDKSSSLFLTPFSHVGLIHLMLLILVCRIHFWCYFHHWGQYSCLLTLLTKSNLAAVGDIRKLIFFVSIICHCLNMGGAEL